MKRSVLSIAMGSALALLIGAGEAAVTMPKEGRFDFNFCLAGRTAAIPINENAVAGSFESTAGIWSNIPGGAFDGQGSRCVGSWAVVDGTYTDGGYCITTDADGDRFLMDFRTGPIRVGEQVVGKWVATAGSGKYARMAAQGEYKAVAKSVPAVEGGFQNCNRNTGTYKLK